MHDMMHEAAAIASRQRRLGAFFVDHTIISLIALAVFFLSSLPGLLDGSESYHVRLSMYIAFAIAAVLMMIKDVIGGVSLGKWIFGIKVSQEGYVVNHAPSTMELLTRNLSMLFWPIEFLILAFGNGEQRIGDRIANTIVVEDLNKPSKLPRVLVLIVVCVFFVASSLLSIMAIIKTSSAYRIAIEDIESSETLRDRVGGITGYGMMPMGSIVINNGYGEAELSIKILGSEQDLNVYICLDKLPRDTWKIQCREIID